MKAHSFCCNAKLNDMIMTTCTFWSLNSYLTSIILAISLINLLHFFFLNTSQYCSKYYLCYKVILLIHICHCAGFVFLITRFACFPLLKCLSLALVGVQVISLLSRKFQTSPYLNDSFSQP